MLTWKSGIQYCNDSVFCTKHILPYDNVPLSIVSASARNHMMAQIFASRFCTLGNTVWSLWAFLCYFENIVHSISTAGVYLVVIVVDNLKDAYLGYWLVILGDAATIFPKSYLWAERLPYFNKQLLVLRTCACKICACNVAIVQGIAANLYCHIINTLPSTVSLIPFLSYRGINWA